MRGGPKKGSGSPWRPIAPTELLALSRAEFLGAVTGSRPSATRANEMIDRRLEELGREE